jgi:1-acyl-sn-glycerol-3-phosphate acyltransferase
VQIADTPPSAQSVSVRQVGSDSGCTTQPRPDGGKQIAARPQSSLDRQQLGFPGSHSVFPQPATIAMPTSMAAMRMEEECHNRCAMSFDPDSLEGRDAALIERLLPLVERFVRAYFRLRVDGAEHVPNTPALFVANHNGGILGPDLFCTLSVLWRTLDRPLYALAHDFAMVQLKPLGRLLQRVGAIRASRANAQRVLDAGHSLLVYPGGDLDAYRHSSRRHEVVILPRTGFVEVARRARVPIVPVVAEGAHDSAYIFSEGRTLARLLRLPRWGRLERFPLAFALPWIFAPSPWLPYAPLPLPIRLRILPARLVDDQVDAHHAAAAVQADMQRALTELAHG